MEIIELFSEEKAVNINCSEDEKYLTVTYPNRVDLYHMNRRRQMDSVYCEQVLYTSISSSLGLIALHKFSGISFYSIKEKKIVKRIRTGKYNFTRGVFYKNMYIYSYYEGGHLDLSQHSTEARWNIKCMDFDKNKNTTIFSTNSAVMQIGVRGDVLVVSSCKKKGVDKSILYTVDLREKKKIPKEYTCDIPLHALGGLVCLFDEKQCYGFVRANRGDKKLKLVSVDLESNGTEDVCEVGHPLFTLKFNGNGRLLYIPEIGFCTIVDVVEKRVIAKISEHSAFNAMPCDHPDYFCLMSGGVKLYKVFDMAT